MNKKLLVKLLRNNIQELNMITEGFMEMDEYPTAIIHLAKRKTEDIQTIIDQLAGTEVETTPETPAIETKEPIAEKTIIQEEPQLKQTDAKPVEIKEEAPRPEKPKVETPAKPIVVNKPEEKAEVETEDKKELVEVKEDKEVKTAAEEPKRTTVADKVAQPTVSRNESHSKEDKSFSASMANKKIDDIKQAISIGDRFRFQRELFNGNGEDMNKILNQINQLNTFEEVESLLKKKFDWNKEIEVTSDFYQIVKRKFL